MPSDEYLLLFVLWIYRVLKHHPTPLRVSPLRNNFPS